MNRLCRRLPLALTTLMAVVAPAAGQVPKFDATGAVAHLRLVTRADSLYGAGRYADAEPLLERIVSETPRDGRAHYRLGRAREETDDAVGAIRSYRASFEQGYGRTPSTAYRVARQYAGLGAPDSAIAWLQRALALRYEDRPRLAADSAFASVHPDPRFRRLAAIPEAPPAGRVAAWRSDIDYLVEEARRMNANPDRPAFAVPFDSAAAALKSEVARLSDAQVLMKLRHLLVLLGDGHSGIYGPGPDSPLRLGAGGALPVEMRQFSDGLFVIDAAGDARRWIGARVVRIGDVAASDLLAALPRYMHHDNEYTALWLGEHFLLPTRDFLVAAGAAREGDEVAVVTLRTSDGIEHRATLAIEAEPPAFPRKLHPPAGLARPPLFLSRVDEVYWLEALPDHDAVYFQFNQVRNADEGPSIPEFADSLRRTLTRTGAGLLIVDVRHNNGGNNGLLRPLLRTMVWWEMQDDAHRIFVVTGRGTFSAAQNFIDRVEALTNATFVGEPSSSSPNFTGEDTNLTLPWSRVTGSISTRYWQESDPGDRRPFIWPDVPVGMASRDYFEGRDPALEAIWAITAR